MIKKIRFLLVTILMLSFFATISFAKTPSITAANDVDSTKSNHYPVIEITNHTDRDILVEWGAFADVYQGNITVPSNTTKALHLPELSFLGKTHDITTVWLTWQDLDFLKPRGTDVITIPFDAPKSPSNTETELGMK